MIQHKGKTVQNQTESVSKHKIIGRRGRNLTNVEWNFKFREATAHSGLDYPLFIFVPHLTSNLQPVGSVLFIVPTPFFHHTFVHVWALSLEWFQRISSKPLKHTSPRKCLNPRLLLIEALIKPFLESSKWNRFFPPIKVPVGYLESNSVPILKFEVTPSVYLGYFNH